MVRLKCEVIDCCQEKSADISLHSIPNNDFEAQKWNCFLQLANAKYPAWKPDKKLIVICSKHFVSTDFRYGVSGKRFILHGHFPSRLHGVDLTTSVVSYSINAAIYKSSSARQSSSNSTVPHNVVEKQAKPIPDLTHRNCNLLIKKQMETIDKLNNKIEELESEVSTLKQDNVDLRRNIIRVLVQRCKRQEGAAKGKNEEIRMLNGEIKRLKKECILPENTTKADNLLVEMIKRRNVPRNQAYSEAMRVFAFNAHYISPKGYAYLRQQFPGLLPDKSNCNRWTKEVQVAPGLLPISIRHIQTTSSQKDMYYSLSFDEMAIRQQILFHGLEMVGKTDYGNLLSSPPPATMAKSALFCLATELNGHKSFPVAYALTNGLKSSNLAEIMIACIRAVEKANGHVLSISFDGLKANFNAVSMLGAKLAVDQEVQPYFIDPETTKMHFVIPDACHMLKLVRNTLDRCEVLFNGDEKPIRWLYIKRLQLVQEREQLRAGNSLTHRHINFHQKKMNVKLCVQVMSEGTATAIDFCRSLQIPGFEDSEATCEFLRMNNITFDILNARPYGDGNKSPLSVWNKYRWSTIISSAKLYYLSLKVMKGNDLVPLYSTKYGTCIKGIITALTGLEGIMGQIERQKINLRYLSTYRLSQDPLELFFGTLRRRLGCNDNPNVAQLAYSLRAVLSFKLNVCQEGNCVPQENLLDCVSCNEKENANNKKEPSEVQEEEGRDLLKSNKDYFENGIDLESFMTLSLFVENVVVYIAGFVGRKLVTTVHCSDCLISLKYKDLECIRFREDCLLLIQKDRGGLFKPSEDLVHVCKITEMIIRTEQSNGILKMNSKKVEVMVKRECVDRNVFRDLHNELSSSTASKASYITHSTHRLSLISEICKIYTKIRLNHIAKRASLEAKPVSTRSKCNKLVHFTGC